MLPRTLAEQRQVPRSRRRRRYCTMQCLLQPDISFARTWQGTPRLTQCWDAGDSECSSDVATDFGLRRARSPHAREARELQRRTFFVPHLFCVRPLRGPSAQAQSPGNRLRSSPKSRQQTTEGGGWGEVPRAQHREGHSTPRGPHRRWQCARGGGTGDSL